MPGYTDRWVDGIHYRWNGSKWVEASDYMVVRVGLHQGPGEAHWSDPPATFGPMPRTQAQEMVNSKYGGQMMTCKQFRESGYR